MNTGVGSGTGGGGAPAAPGATAGAPAGAEDEVVARIALALARASGPPPPGSLWIGDDAAVLAPLPGPWLLATDAAVAGVHADLTLVGLDDLAWKALTATVSDLGAMGGRPCYALVTACLPPRTDADLLAAGLAEASARWACPVVGGDVTGADQVMVSVAAVGSLDGPAPAVARSGASPGDALFVTGPLGSSAAGLRLLRTSPADEVSAALMAAHRRPVARLREGATARAAGATAMIDVSDGLSVDLHRLADASGVGFRLTDVPVAEGATEEEALGGGEDYELVVATADPAALRAAFTAEGLRPPLAVGRCTADPGERLLRGGTLGRRGWQHRLG